MLKNNVIRAKIDLVLSESFCFKTEIEDEDYKKISFTCDNFEFRT